MIDEDGFRANVGIILCNRNNRLFWGHRIGHLDSWQFPQGGMNEGETPLDAMYRELKEEIGLNPDDVTVLDRTKNWLKYRLPQRLIRKNNARHCIGQKQIWFLLKYRKDSDDFVFDSMGTPEFDQWCWIDYWLPINQVVHFKQQVYFKALTELAPALFGENIPKRPRLKTHRNHHTTLMSPRLLYRNKRRIY